MSGLDNCPCCSEVSSIIPETYQNWSVNDESLIPLVDKAMFNWTCKPAQSYFTKTPGNYHMLFDWDYDFEYYWEYAIGIFIVDVSGKPINNSSKYSGTTIALHPSLYNSYELISVVTHELGHSLGLFHMVIGMSSIMAPFREEFFDKPTENDIYILKNLQKVNKQRGNRVFSTSDTIFDNI